MESIFEVCVIFFLMSRIDRVVCDSQEIVFEIKDGELNQVLFIGERNITLMCYVFNIIHADMTINIAGGVSEASNNAIGNFVEYTIPEITEQSDLDYSCIARYKDENTGQIVEICKLLSLNVRHTSMSVCFRNGSGPTEEYTEGDTLLLSCYCINDLGCFWTQTLVGFEVGDRVQPNYIYQHNNKILLQIVVGPLNSTDVSLRYDCVHGSQSDERCSIGPANASINDTILQPIPTSDHSKGCPTMLTPITGVITGEMSISEALEDNDFDKDEANYDFFALIIAMVVALLILFTIIVLVLFILSIRKKKNRQTESNTENSADQEFDGKSEAFAISYENDQVIDETKYYEIT